MARRGLNPPRKLGGKRPVHLAAEGGFLTAQEHVWAAIRARHAAGRTFTLPDLGFDTKLSEGTVRGYLERLIAGGYIAATLRRPRSDAGKQFRHTPYRLVLDRGVIAPRLRKDGTPATNGLAAEQLWRTMKIIGEFDGRDLQLAASTVERQIALPHALQYIKALHHAGYLKLTAPHRGGRGRTLARYRFFPSMNTGPRAPMLQRGGAVFDANKAEVVWQPKT